MKSRYIVSTAFVGMRSCLAVAAIFVLGVIAKGQDIGWLIESAPAVSMILVKTLDTCPTFSAGVEVKVSGNADPIPSTASGVVESRNGSLRWEVKLGEIQSAQLSPTARAAVRQINGDQFVLLTRPDQLASYLVLAGARAYLEQSLPSLRLASKARPVSESLEGRPCLKERFTAVLENGSTNQIVVWKTKEQVPVQVQVTDEGEVIQIRFNEVHFRTVVPERFQVPPNLSKYTSVEDLVQSVLVDRVKRRFGLE